MSTRDLWSAVVLEAAEDVRLADYTSVAYAQAVSFFTAPGLWAESRQNIADCIGLHPDDIMRLGRQVIAARHLRDGPEPVIERVAALPVQPNTRPEPNLTNPAPVVTKPDLPKPPSKQAAARRVKRVALAEKRDREWWIRHFLAKQQAA